ncbi:MAG: hypothetical protein V1810_01275 [Candidatus Beckwithbacteria bacterium]
MDNQENGQILVYGSDRTGTVSNTGIKEAEQNSESGSQTIVMHKSDLELMTIGQLIEKYSSLKEKIDTQNQKIEHLENIINSLSKQVVSLEKWNFFKRFYYFVAGFIKKKVDNLISL